MIKGGYILKPRIIQDSDISDCSPCVRETWDYLIREANHEDYKNGKFEIKRGQLFRTYDEILNALSWNVGWRKETYTENQMKQAMKNLREHGRITTQKKPGGVLITICKYSFYQNPKNYEQTKEEPTEQTIEKPSTNHRQTSHNYKNEKNVKNEKNNSKQVADVPSLSEVQDYFKEKGFDTDLANKFYDYYNEPMEDRNGRVWKDQNGKTVKSWKQKALAVWMKSNGKKEKEFDPVKAREFYEN